MIVASLHYAHWGALVVSIAWMCTAAIYYVSTTSNTEPVRKILRPLRLFGMWLSIVWAGWYLAIFFGYVDAAHDLISQVIDGLVFTTAIFLMAVSTTASRMLRRLGVE